MTRNVFNTLVGALDHGQWIWVRYKSMLRTLTISGHFVKPHPDETDQLKVRLYTGRIVWIPSYRVLEIDV